MPTARRRRQRRCHAVGMQRRPPPVARDEAQSAGVDAAREQRSGPASAPRLETIAVAADSLARAHQLLVAS
eukprot:11222070-Lingulodinium_polyedra.AAC.1